MTDVLKPGAGILFMKVGTHAQEELDAIIERKQKEISEAGFALWGYGGNTCHPVNMVQPFADEYASAGQAIVLCMEPMELRHFAEPIRAEEYSSDGLSWERIPETINAVGSRYALFIEDLKKEEFELPLSATKVAIGPSAGRAGHRYIQGRVDKACLTVSDPAERVNDPDLEKTIHIGLTASLCKPYAAFLRTRTS